MASFLNFKHLALVKKVDVILNDVARGKREFDCPDITLELNGNAYSENEIEAKFIKRAKVEVMRTIVGYSLIGYIGGMILTRGQPKFNRTVGSFCCFMMGSSVGGTKASINTMRKQMDIDGSPIALEMRYQVWREQPDHEWLHKYQNDIRRWSYESFGNEMTDTDDENTNRTVDTQQYDHKKRERFYQNRERLGQRQPPMFDSKEQSAPTNHGDNEMRWG